MDRRSFIKGTFGGVAAGGLILAATPSDIAAFTSSGIEKGAEMVSTPLPMAPVPAEGHILFNSKGDPVAVITHIKWNRNPVDVSLAGDSYSTYMGGPPIVALEAVMYGTATLKGYQGQFIIGNQVLREPTDG